VGLKILEAGRLEGRRKVTRLQEPTFAGTQYNNALHGAAAIIRKALGSCVWRRDASYPLIFWTLVSPQIVDSYPNHGDFAVLKLISL
jgi:hypothetical protein